MTVTGRRSVPITPNEVIKRARTQFGEEVALTATATNFQEWVNNALLELYDDLPPSELRQLITETSVSLTDGEGSVPDTWDRVIDVKTDDGVPLLRLRPETVRHIDSNQFFTPSQTVWALLDSTILVRPTSVSSVLATHQDPPTTLEFPADEDTEITEVNKRWHIALVHLVTSYAYQREEDHNAAAHWRSRYNQLVGAVQPVPVEDDQE